MNKIVFYLMGEKGLYVLKGFLEEYSAGNIEYVVLAKDKNVINDYNSELKGLCEKNSLKYYDRTDDLANFKGYKFAIGWRWIIDDCEKLIVLHDSILPKYRGFAPLVNMLVNGEEKIGVTALFASKEYDRGNIIKQEQLSINYPIKIKAAIELISILYSNLVNGICDLIFKLEKIIGTPQQEEKASYSLWRDELDYLIDWNSDSKKIKRLIDATGYPYNGASTYLNGKKIIIDDAEEYPDLDIENRDVGKVIFIEEGFPIIVCGKGLLKIKEARFLDNTSILPLKRFRSRFGRRCND
jgi:methionyl-tRNA formyltransferase